MTEFWVSNPKHYCEICNTWCDAKPGQIRLHEAGEKHKKNVLNYNKRRKREKWLKEKEDAIARKEMQKIEEAAMQAFEKDKALGVVGTRKSGNNSMLYNMESKATSGGLTEKSYVKESMQEQIDRLNREYGFQIDPDISDIPKEPVVEEGKEPPERDGWFYCTDKGEIKGPFKTDEMAKWYDEGWFKPTLKVRNQAEGAYKYLKEMENPFFINEYRERMKGDQKRKLWEEEKARMEESSDDEDESSDSSDPEPAPVAPTKELIVDADFSTKKQDTTVEAPEANITENEISTALNIDPIFGTAVWSEPIKLSREESVKKQIKKENQNDEDNQEGDSDHEMDHERTADFIAKAYGLDKMRKGVKRKVQEATAGLDKAVQNSFVSTTFQKRSEAESARSDRGLG